MNKNEQLTCYSNSSSCSYSKDCAPKVLSNSTWVNKVNNNCNWNYVRSLWCKFTSHPSGGGSAKSGDFLGEHPGFGVVSSFWLLFSFWTASQGETAGHQHYASHHHHCVQGNKTCSDTFFSSKFYSEKVSNFSSAICVVWICCHFHSDVFWNCARQDCLLVEMDYVTPARVLQPDPTCHPKISAYLIKIWWIVLVSYYTIRACWHENFRDNFTHCNALYEFNLMQVGKLAWLLTSVLSSK